MRPSVATLLLILVIAIPLSAAPEPKKLSPIDESAQIAEKLLERIDLDRPDQVTLRDILEWLQTKSGLTMLIDTKAIAAARGPEAVAVLNDSAIRLPAMKNVRMETVLRAILDQIDADFVIAPDHIKVTTAAVKDQITGSARSLPELYPNLGEESAQLDRTEVVRTTPYVTIAFRDTPAADAFKEIAARAGRNVVISAAAADKAKTTVAVNLSNVAFDTAVASIAEAAGLRAFRTGNVVVVVTPERAKPIDAQLAIAQTGSLGAAIGPICAGFGIAGDNGESRIREITEKVIKDRLAKLNEELEKLKKK